MKAVIYHDPGCEDSVATIDLLEKANLNVEVIQYLKNPPSKAELKKIIKSLDLPIQEIIRKKDPDYKYISPDMSEDQIVSTLRKHPRLIKCPIVITEKGAVIARPPEAVLDII